MDALFIRAVLARAPGLRATHVHALLTAADGDLTRSIEPETLAHVSLPARARAALLRPDKAALVADLEWTSCSGAHLPARSDTDYPSQLLPITDAPAVLFVLGDPRR